MNEAKQPPLVELLDSIPINQTLKVHTKNPLGFDTHNYPVSDYCHSAADELRRQAARITELEKELYDMEPAYVQQALTIKELQDALRQAVDTLKQASLDDSFRNYQMEADCIKLIKETLK